MKKVIKPTSRTSEISAHELEALKSELEREDVNETHEEDMEIEKFDKVSGDETQDITYNYNTLPGGISEEDFNIQPNYTVAIEDIFSLQSTENPHGSSKELKSIDCDTLFLISLARDLQKIPEEQKLDVKIELMQVLKMAKKRESKRNSVQNHSQQQRKMTMKYEADSESSDEQSRDSIRHTICSDLLEKDDI